MERREGPSAHWFKIHAGTIYYICQLKGVSTLKYKKKDFFFSPSCAHKSDFYRVKNVPTDETWPQCGV